jgi:O-antigen ligase
LDTGRAYAFTEWLRVGFANPLGIPLGSWFDFSSAPPPHNFFLFSLVYGGVISLLVVIGFSVWLFLFIARGELSGLDAIGQSSAAVMVTIFVASLFEQVFLTASSVCIFLFCAAQTFSSLFAVRARHKQLRTRRGRAVSIQA